VTTQTNPTLVLKSYPKGPKVNCSKSNQINVKDKIEKKKKEKRKDWIGFSTIRQSQVF